MSYDIEYMKKLEAAGELACDAAQNHRNEIQDAVNWGDLHCHYSSWRIDSDGTSCYVVNIQEVSPTADRLRAFIDGYLESLGHKGIVIELEW